ncbi:hypothetical protein [Streptomyces longwoodensis]|uniref:hypothetical protein n=1 Tax=Streptomyces longwoodensis TaxID=68231 RepID=UPI0033FBE799
MLSLLVVLVGVLGAGCPCLQNHAGQPVAVTSAEDMSGERAVGQRVCRIPGRDQCAAKAEAGAPTLGPGPHPEPRVVPGRAGAPALAVVEITVPHSASPQPPDLHMLKVLRT